MKGIARVRKRLADGRTVSYHYAWRGGPRFWSSSDGTSEGGPEYWAAYDAALSTSDIGTRKFRKLIRLFLGSPEFARLAPRTQDDYRRSIFQPKLGIDAEFGDVPMKAMDDPRIRQKAYLWRDRFASPRVADHRKTHLVRIVSWSVDRGYLARNPMEGMSNLYSVDRSQIVWAPDEIAIVIERGPPHLARAMIVATEAGLRLGDQIRLELHHVVWIGAQRRIRMETGKSRGRTRVDIPITPLLAKVIDDTPKDRAHVLVGARGKPWAKASSLSHAMTDLKTALGLRPELHYHDARGACVTRLLAAGVTLDEIARHMGWRPSYAARMLDVYASL